MTTAQGASQSYKKVAVMPCPNGCNSALYHSGYRVRCQLCGLAGPEQHDHNADTATKLWNALPRPN